MLRFGKASSFNVMSFGAACLAFTYVHVLLLIFMATALIRARNSAPYTLFLLFVLGAILFLAYFVTSWAAKPRYYAPSLMTPGRGHRLV